jgi:hypothetical protein
MEVNLPALMREEAFTLRAMIQSYIDRPVIELPTDTIDVPLPVTTKPVKVSNTGNTAPASGKGTAYTEPAPARAADSVYTFVCLDRNVKAGDTVLVACRQGICLAVVTDVDSEVVIEPGDTIRYEYVVARVDLTNYIEEMRKNAEIQKVYRDSYRVKAREAFRQQLMLGVDEAGRERLQSLLK